MMLDGLNAKGRRDVGLAGAWATNKDNVLGPVHELTAMQGVLTLASLISLAAKSKPERSL